MKQLYLVLFVTFLAACGQVEAVQSKLTDSHDKVTVKVEKQGIALSLAPATGVTYTSVTWELVKDAEGTIASGNLDLGKENFIPIPYQGSYCIIVRLTTSDGRSGMGETCFKLGWNELKHIKVGVIIPPNAQGVGVSVTTETAPVLVFELNPSSPSGVTVSGQIEVFRFNVTEGIEYPLPATLSELAFLISRGGSAYVVGCVLHDMTNNIVMNFEQQVDFPGNSYDLSGNFPLSSEVYTAGDVTLMPGTTRTLSVMCEVHAQPNDSLKVQLVLVNASWQAAYISNWPEGNTITF